LPMRSLHFATEQMYWECAQASQCEDGEGFGAGDEDFRIDAITQGLQSSSLRYWFQLVSAYTSRNITYYSDRLPALSGVIAAIGQKTGDLCYAGIWKYHFLEGLMWRLEDPDLDSYVITPKQPKKLDFWRAPSWSFFAVEGIVRYNELSTFGTGYCATLEECSITPAGENPLGELKSGFAKLRGPVTVVEQVGKDGTSEGLSCLLRLRGEYSVEAKVRFDFDTLDPCPVIMITPHTGLALKSISISRCEYVRIGTVQVWKDPNNPVLSSLQYPAPVTITLL